MAERGFAISNPELRWLYEYWREKRSDRLAPTRAEMHSEELRALLPFIYIIDVADAPRRFRYRLVGTQIVQE